MCSYTICTLHIAASCWLWITKASQSHEPMWVLCVAPTSTRWQLDTQLLNLTCRSLFERKLWIKSITVGCILIGANLSSTEAGCNFSQAFQKSFVSARIQDVPNLSISNRQSCVSWSMASVVPNPFIYADWCAWLWTYPSCLSLPAFLNGIEREIGW